MLLYVHRNHRLFRDGSPGRPPWLSHSSWALCESKDTVVKVLNLSCAAIAVPFPSEHSGGYTVLQAERIASMAVFCCCVVSKWTLGVIRYWGLRGLRVWPICFCFCCIVPKWTLRGYTVLRVERTASIFCFFGFVLCFVLFVYVLLVVVVVVNLSHGQPHAVFRGYISICRRWMLLYPQLIAHRGWR